jgi:uroporphyrinogen decarboxylase
VLLDRIVDVVAPVAQAQLEAGCDAIQLFDSWAGVLPADVWQRHCRGPFTRLVRTVQAAGAPAIAFVNGALQHLPTVVETGADCVSVDWRIHIAQARRALPSRFGLQGNLDPCALFLADDDLRRTIEQLLRDAGPVGHVMNLGHGILPDTDPGKVQLLVDTVRSFKA